ncbi:hypothetical protein [Pelomonas cellulosilytica]|uniref:hypothetical protein n=1 Tax=Pelomonas cellulosilytica TaxID=2906762 RepID=UPI003B02C1D8
MSLIFQVQHGKADRLRVLAWVHQGTCRQLQRMATVGHPSQLVGEGGLNGTLVSLFELRGHALAGMQQALEVDFLVPKGLALTIERDEGADLALQH